MALYHNSKSGSRKTLTPSEAFIQIGRYCAYQERSHREVRNKLYDYGLHRGDVEDLLTRLITEGFLNEERFAKAFAGGKFRMKKWGRNKIVHELEAHGITPRCIERGLREIDNNEYSKVLTDLLKKKYRATSEPNPFTRKDKTARFAIGKGYEPDLVWSIIREMTGTGD